MITDVLKGFQCFLDGDRYVGKVTSFAPPVIESTEDQFRGSGMDGSIPIDMGLEPLTCELTIAGVDREAAAKFGLLVGITTTLTVRGGVKSPASPIVLPVVHTCVGNVRKLDPGEWTPADKASTKITMSLTAYKYLHGANPVPVYDIDTINNIRQINGIDQLAALRIAMGG